MIFTHLTLGFIAKFIFVVRRVDDLFFARCFVDSELFGRKPPRDGRDVIRELRFPFGLERY